MNRSYSPRGFASLQAVRSSSTGTLKLRIRLPKTLFEGKSRFLYLRLDDTPTNRVYAERRLSAINTDILNDCFDLTLEKYKPQASKKNHQERVRALNLPTISILFREYVGCHQKKLSPNTYLKNHLYWLKRIEQSPPETLIVSEEGSFKLLEYLSSNFSDDANRRLFNQLDACCNWAIKSGRLKTSNPYGSIKEAIPKSRKKRRVTSFFSKQEIQTILRAFAQHSRYSHYENYVAFLFATGARPSEIVCLNWSDVDGQFVYFTKRAIESTDGWIIQEGLKSENKRKFPINNLVQSILDKQKGQKLEGDLIFPSFKGKMIDFACFRKTAWKRILKELGMEYRKPYASRASFITHSLEYLDPKDVGRICGNLPETIYKHYAGSDIDSLRIPDLF